MGLMDSLKHRLSTNMKVTQLMFMTQPMAIVQFCRGLNREDRAGVLKGIESAFKWQPVAQIAQALFPAQQSSNVAADAADLAKGGFISGAVDLMGMQSQSVQPQYGMTAAQQAALSYAWTVLKSIEQQDGISRSPQVAQMEMQDPGEPAGGALYCSRCGTKRPEGANFCNRCGSRYA